MIQSVMDINQYIYSSSVLKYNFEVLLLWVLHVFIYLFIFIQHWMWCTAVWITKDWFCKKVLIDR